MAGIGLLTPARRDTLLVILAVGLLLGPVWVSVFDLGEPTYRYERARITVGGESGLAYANGTPAQVRYNTPISEDIGCSVPEDIRVCVVEQYVLNHTIPTDSYTSNPAISPTTYDFIVERYRYVILNGTAYETVLVPNISVQIDRGLYRLDLGLRPEPLRDVLPDVSLNATTERDEMARPIYRAAVDGRSKSHRRIDDPQKLIRIENGTYYRVYLADITEASSVEQLLATFLPVGGPVVGLLMLYVLSRRFEVSHRGTRTERWEN